MSFAKHEGLSVHTHFVHSIHRHLKFLLKNRFTCDVSVMGLSFLLCFVFACSQYNVTLGPEGILAHSFRCLHLTEKSTKLLKNPK